jgi:hypothetical protein
MSDDVEFRREIKHVFDGVRIRIGSYTGLYADEDLLQDLQQACGDLLRTVAPEPRLDVAMHALEDRCRHLAKVTDRFAERDPDVIATARAQAVAAVDMLQDAIFDLRKAEMEQRVPRRLLKRRGR